VVASNRIGRGRIHKPRPQTQSCQFAGIDSRHDVLISDGFQINHRGSQVFVPHPILQGLDIADVILEIARGKCVPEFVQKEIRAVREQYGPSKHLFPCFETHCRQFIFAWKAMRFSLNSWRLSGRPDSFGKTNASAFGFFDPLYFLSAAISDSGTGTSRSSLFLGLNA
jgi:hypothetical protein